MIIPCLLILLIAASIIDIRTKTIPDVLTVGGMIVGLYLFGMSALIGTLVGGGLLFIVSLFGLRVFGKASFGGGDIKLLAMIGALCGWKVALLTFSIAPFLALAQGFLTRKSVAYAPYLSAGCLIALNWWGL